MTTPTAARIADVVVDTMMVCQRSGPGHGCTRLRFSLCRTCGWTGELWDGDQPPLTDAGHACPPDDPPPSDSGGGRG